MILQKKQKHNQVAIVKYRNSNPHEVEGWLAGPPVGPAPAGSAARSPARYLTEDERASGRMNKLKIWQLVFTFPPVPRYCLLAPRRAMVLATPRYNIRSSRVRETENWAGGPKRRFLGVSFCPNALKTEQERRRKKKNNEPQTAKPVKTSNTKQGPHSTFLQFPSLTVMGARTYTTLSVPVAPSVPGRQQFIRIPETSHRSKSSGVLLCTYLGQVGSMANIGAFEAEDATGLFVDRTIVQEMRFSRSLLYHHKTYQFQIARVFLVSDVLPNVSLPGETPGSTVHESPRQIACHPLTTTTLSSLMCVCVQPNPYGRAVRVRSGCRDTLPACMRHQHLDTLLQSFYSAGTYIHDHEHACFNIQVELLL